jgi:hypothetical protein
MRRAWVTLLMGLAGLLAACSVFGAAKALTVPGWCASTDVVSIPVRESMRPLASVDPAHVLCLAARNESKVDMTLRETGGGSTSQSLIAACEGTDGSESGVVMPWSLEVGRSGPENLDIVGPILARFDGSRLAGPGPYMVEVLIHADLTVTIAQRDKLHDEAHGGNC